MIHRSVAEDLLSTSLNKQLEYVSSASGIVFIEQI